jgi:hypothetical protein
MEMKNITRITIAGTIAVASLGGGITAAAAQPNQNANCVAILGHELGNLGQYQRSAHDPTAGQRIIRYVASFRGNCDEIPE